MQGPHQRTSWHFNTTAGTAQENKLALQYQCRDCTREPVGTSIPTQGPHQRSSRTSIPQGQHQKTSWHFNSTADTAPENQSALQYQCMDCTREPTGTSIPMQEPHQKSSRNFNTTTGTAPEDQLALQYHPRYRTREPVGTSMSMQGLHQRTSWHFNTTAGININVATHLRNTVR